MHRKKPLQPGKVFIVHLTRNILISLSFIIMSLYGGMWGYHHYERMTWIDSFANAAMILSGMGPLEPLKTNDGKLFAGFYALYSGLALIIALGVFFAPVMRRFLHQLDLDTEEEVIEPKPSPVPTKNSTSVPKQH